MRFFAWWVPVLLVGLVGATGCESPIVYQGGRAIGLFALPNGEFLVAVADDYGPCNNVADCTLTEDLFLERRASSGALTWRAPILRGHARFGRTMMKRLGSGQMLLSLSDASTVYFVADDATSVESHEVPSNALSRMKDMNDWLVGGIGDDARIHRYRVTDTGALIPEVYSADPIAANETVHDVRATADGGLAAWIEQLGAAPPHRLVKLDAGGAATTTYVPTTGTLGRLLNSTTTALRFVVALDGGAAAIRTLEPSTMAESDVPLGTALTDLVWPIDDGGVVADSLDGVRLWSADGTMLWGLPASGTTTAIFSNGMRTLVASHDGGFGASSGTITVKDVDASGVVTASHQLLQY